MTEKTFQDLGLEFPLFEAPLSCASGFLGDQTCSICSQRAPCFRGGIGVDVNVTCGKCGTVNVELGNEVADGSRECKRCNASLSLLVGPEGEPVICYDCLRAGRATITKDTEFGLVRREDAERGQTLGVPHLETKMFDTIPTDEDGWSAAVIPESDLNELIRTPGYTSWQGDIWLFCCSKPMVFVGEWGIEDFRQHSADGNVGALVAKMSHPSEAQHWHGMFPDWGVNFYVFRCSGCGKYRAHNDSD